MFSPLALVFILSLLPQGDTGQLSGSVVDAHGNHIVGANVKLISKTTSQVREFMTRDSGDFTFTLLPPGRYNLEVVAPNFKNALIEDVSVNITQTTTLLVHLEVGALIGEDLVIRDVAPLVQQESQVGRVIEGQTLRQLPLPTRNFQQLLNVHEISGPHLRGLGIGVFLCLVHVLAYGVGARLMGQVNDLLGAATNPGVMRYGFLISPISCCVAAILLWRGSRTLENLRQD